VLADENVSMAVVVACPTAVLSYENLAEVIVEQQASSDQPIAATLMGGKSVGSAAPMLNDAGVPTYFDPARAVDSLDALRRYGEIQAREYVDPETFDVDRDRARGILEGRGRARPEPPRRGGDGSARRLRYPDAAGDVVNSPERPRRSPRR